MPEGELKEAAENIVMLCDSQSQLVEDILDMTRLARGSLRLELRPMDVTDVLSAVCEVMRPAARAKSVRLETDWGARRAEVMADPGRLKQVMWNLTNNAMKFTPEGGSITVRQDVADRVVRLEVRDTGRGIEPDLLPHVFEPFRQGGDAGGPGEGGLGLGLSIVKQLVELHGGTVTADSPGGGRGAIFTVELPMLETGEAQRTPPGQAG
jgi:signal transduction histidine kinase